MCRRIVPLLPLVIGVLLLVSAAASAQAPDLLTLGRQECGLHGAPSLAGYSVLSRGEIWTVYGIGPTGQCDTEEHVRRVLSGSLLEASGVRYLHGADALAASLHGAARAGRFVERWRTPDTFTLESAAYAGRAYRVERAEGYASEEGKSFAELPLGEQDAYFDRAKEEFE